MKKLISSTVFAGLMMISAYTKAQTFYNSIDSAFSETQSVQTESSQRQHIRDSVLPGYILDSIRDHGFFMMLAGGGAAGVLSGQGGSGGTVDLTTVFGKNLIDFSYSYMSSGSITTGTAGGFIVTNPAPTVPLVSQKIFEASYGQRLSPTVAWTAGLAYVERTRNTPTTKVTDPGGWFDPGGTYWQYYSKDDSYFAVPISIDYFWRWASWLGGEFKGQLLCSGRDVSCSVGFSVGIGGFPDASPHWAVVNR